MKYRFDLLPDEYRSSPRDNVGIFFAIVAIIITIAAIGTTMIKNKATFAGIDKKIAESKRELENKYSEINNEKPDANKINEVRKSIEFIIRILILLLLMLWYF